jgi:hypothetical protein
LAEVTAGCDPKLDGIRGSGTLHFGVLRQFFTTGIQRNAGARGKSELAELAEATEDCDPKLDARPGPRTLHLGVLRRLRELGFLF